MLMRQAFPDCPIPQPWERHCSLASDSRLDSSSSTRGKHVGLQGLGRKEEDVVLAANGDTDLEPYM